jgi:uncharacterized protein (TIGR02145 family)
MKKPLYIITILANCLFAFSQSPDKFSIQPAIEVDANFYKITLELKEGKDDDDYKQKDKVDLPVTFLFNNKFVTGKYTGSCIKIKVLYTDSKKEQSDKLYLPSGKGKFTSTSFSYDGDWQFDNFNGMGSIQWENNQYEGLFNQNKFRGKGNVIYTNGDRYDGDFVDYIKQGSGMYTFKNRALYRGQWVNDNYDGRGILNYENGDSYEGDFVVGKRHGYGRFIFKNGESYNGQWVNDKRNGKGKSSYTNGDTYDGDFVDDKKQGNGTYTFKTGALYTGPWSNNYYNGKGKLTYVNGTIYEGDFVDNFYKGKGKLTYANGDIYEGDFVDDKKQGNGTYTFKAGGSYTGQWADNKYNGKGKLIDKNGGEYDGNFVNGKKQGNGKMTEGDVIIYNGQWANDLYNGHGELNMPTQTGDNPYIGDFVDGKKQGNGTQKYNHELGGVVTYTGQWANDEYNGQGKLILRDNKIQEGLFLNGIYQAIAKKTATTVKTSVKEVTIGTQIWMAENVTVAKFRNGDLIPQAKSIEEWKLAANKNQPVWCYYDFIESNGLKYGKLYNWHAVNDSRGLAPTGWRIPSPSDFGEMKAFSTENRNYLKDMENPYFISNNNDMRNKIISDIKSKTGWDKNGTNASGFNALPSGYFKDGFYGKGDGTYFWTSVCCSSFDSSASALQLNKYTSDIGTNDYKGNGFSVRCIKE